MTPEEKRKIVEELRKNIKVKASGVGRVFWAEGKQPESEELNHGK